MRNDLFFRVSGINVEIRSGELTCLIGSNGIGKSTLLKTLTGFLPKLDGRLLLDGREIDGLTTRERSKLISIVLTYKPDVQNLSVTEMVGMGRMPYTGFWGKLGVEDQTIVAQSIEMVGITKLKDRMIQTLSDGERQKVMIAKALAQQTPIILLDEPTAMALRGQTGEKKNIFSFENICFSFAFFISLQTDKHSD